MLQHWLNDSVSFKCSRTDNHIKTITTYKSKTMNKIILSLAAMLIMSVNVFAANDDGAVNQLAVKSFKSDFASATNITWEQKKNFTRATFTMEGQIFYAYYGNNGELQAVVRNITAAQLPITLLTDMKKDYASYQVTDLFEMVVDGATTYYVTLETNEKKVVLRSNGASYWETFSKEKKI